MSQNHHHTCAFPTPCSSVVTYLFQSIASKEKQEEDSKRSVNESQLLVSSPRVGSNAVLLVLCESCHHCHARLELGLWCSTRGAGIVSGQVLWCNQGVCVWRGKGGETGCQEGHRHLTWCLWSSGESVPAIHTPLCCLTARRTLTMHHNILHEHPGVCGPSAYECARVCICIAYAVTCCLHSIA